MKLNSLALRYLASVVAAAFLVACGSSRQASTAHRTPAGKGKTTSVVPPKNQFSDLVIDANLAAETQKLLKEARAWLGVPYLYGGNNRDGVDCSGFVLNVFSNALEISLPRTSRQQNDYCSTLSRDELRPGDLVFFDTKKERDGEVSHVGLYVGDGNMIHASSSKGVIVTSIDSRFYSTRFLAGGRVAKFQALLDKDKRTPSKKSDENSSAKLLAKADRNKKHESDRGVDKTQTAKAKIKSSEKKKTEKAANMPPAPAHKLKTAAAARPSGDAPDALNARATVLNSLIEEKLDSICTPQAMR